MTREEAIRRIRDHNQIHARKEPRAVAISAALAMAINSLIAWEAIQRDIEFEISIQGNKDIKQGLRNALGYIKKHSALLPEQRPCNKCKHHKDTGCEVWECDPKFIEAYGGERMEEAEYEDFSEEIPKKKTFWIHDMDMTFDEELTQEEMEKRFFDALRNAGVIGHRGCPD